jgi:hypothetical protein
LEHDYDKEARGFASYPTHGDIEDEPKARTRKDADIEEEDGEFREVLNEGIK